MTEALKRTGRGPAGIALLIAAVGAIAAMLLLSGLAGGNGNGPTPAQASCGSLKVKTEVVSKFPKVFANQYDKKLRISVKRGGHAVHHWRAELYTFGGYLLGRSKWDPRMGTSDRAALKLRQSMQPGKYTLVVKGSVGRCGELERDQIVNFRGCLNSLPIKFVDKPGGTAADYGRYLSVKIAPKPVWAPLQDIRGTLSNFEGDVYGSAELPRGSRKLIGEQFLDFKLKKGGLQKGGYSVYVTGKARQPKQCGNLAKSTSLRFK
jgi:hypothetical protein